MLLLQLLGVSLGDWAGWILVGHRWFHLEDLLFEFGNGPISLLNDLRLNHLMTVSLGSIDVGVPHFSLRLNIGLLLRNGVPLLGLGVARWLVGGMGNNLLSIRAKHFLFRCFIYLK